MENLDKLPFKEPPPTDATLAELCCRKVAIGFDSYDYDTLSSLPNPVLSALIRCLTPYNLHGMTAILQQKGIDAGPMWKKHTSDALQHKRWLLNSETSYIDVEDMQHFIIYRRACRFHQTYLSLHCGTLLKKLIAAKDTEALPGIYKSLLHFLPSVLYIKIRMERFNRILEWDDVLAIMLNHLQTLVITDIEDIMLSLTLSDTSLERSVRLLKKFCDSNTLKAIVFQSRFFGCTFGEKFGHKLGALLQVIGKDNNSVQRQSNTPDSTEKQISANESQCTVEEISLKDETDNRLFDDALTSSENRKRNFSDVLKQIDQNLANSEDDNSENAEERNSLISLSFRHQEYFDVLEHYLPKWHFLKRLSIEGDDFDAPLPPGLFHEILVRVGCHNFSHLRLDEVKAANIVPQMLYILCEYYRKDGTSLQPMELLNLSSTDNNFNDNSVIDHIEELSVEQFSKFKSSGEIHAVRDLCLSRLDLDQLGFTALKTFLHLNSCLTNLRLIFVGWKSAPVYNGYPAWNHAEDSQAPDLLWISVLESLMENKVLKSVSLWHLELATNGEKLFLTMTLCDFLNRIRTLQTLKLVGCCIPEDLVTSSEFIEAVQNHPSLTVLSLSKNKLGPSGAQFLSSLLVTNRCRRLQELDISSCNIHGKDLLTAAKTLSKCAITEPLLNKLDISGMLLDEHRPGGTLHKELRQEFQNVTQCLEADFHGNYMADHVANM